MSPPLAQVRFKSLFILEHSASRCAIDNSFGPFSNCRLDFTLLFEQCILSGVPSAILLLACTIRILHPHNQDQKIVKSHVLAVTYALLQLVHLTFWIRVPSFQTIGTVLAATVNLAAGIAIVPLSYLEHSRSVRPPAVLEPLMQDVSHPFGPCVELLEDLSLMYCSHGYVSSPSHSPSHFSLLAFLNFWEKPEDENSRMKGYLLIVATSLIYLGIALSSLHSNQALNRFIAIFRGATVYLIYNKTLIQRDGTYDESSAVTLMGADVDRIAFCLDDLPTYILHTQDGWPRKKP
ncbi:uncharacterized protein PAC_19180 [Phialocephala subalpina]|uniref:ABC transporter TMD0 domain-containing protein n=1 Tax=Phialocephala subalpina TaxID=576137 RepID=A0A1L7XWA9_9HELO|nr:uncharacterized protein PAC_19180 [Phialocephala subalpina]